MTRIIIIASYYLDFSASHWIISNRSSKYSHRVKRYRRLYSINTRNVHKKLIVINSCCCQVNFEVLQRGQVLSEVALHFRWNIYQLCAIAVCVFLTHELNLLFMFHVIIVVCVCTDIAKTWKYELQMLPPWFWNIRIILEIWRDMCK